jgi:acyl carrier protein
LNINSHLFDCKAGIQYGFVTMGLDYVELVLALESRFKIHISDEEAGSVRTVGDLYQVVLANLKIEPEGESRGCLTSAAFYRTRRALVNALSLDRRDIRPSTPLEPILPWTKRRRLWRCLQSKTELSIPKLRHPNWIQMTLLATGVLVAMVPIRSRPLDLNTALTAIGLSLLGLCVAALFMRITMPLALGFPSGVVTVGDLAKSVLAINYSRLLEEIGQQNRKDVWDALCAVMIEQLGVKASQIKPDASIANDLRID